MSYTPRPSYSVRANTYFKLHRPTEENASEVLAVHDAGGAEAGSRDGHHASCLAAVV